MPKFYYRHIREMEPRPGMKVGTRYIRQTPEEYDRLHQWLQSTAQEIMTVLETDPDMDAWFVQPLKSFRRSQRGEYYSAQEIVTDLLHQMSLGRDVPEAMTGRWNRLCAHTPWQIDLEPMTQAMLENPEVIPMLHGAPARSDPVFSKLFDLS